jgi:hypothetical protein
MPREITYRIDFQLRSGVEARERTRFPNAVAGLDVHPERVEVSAEGTGAIIYSDPPVDAAQRELLVAWLKDHPAVQWHRESVSPVPGLVYEFTCPAAPVQAEGTIAGHPLYFRARWDEWSFAVSEHPGLDPAAITSPDIPEDGGWFRGGVLPDLRAASYMPSGEAVKLIQICAREYLACRAA